MEKVTENQTVGTLQIRIMDLKEVKQNNFLLENKTRQIRVLQNEIEIYKDDIEYIEDNLINLQCVQKDFGLDVQIIDKDNQKLYKFEISQPQIIDFKNKDELIIDAELKEDNQIIGFIQLQIVNQSSQEKDMLNEESFFINEVVKDIYCQYQQDMLDKFKFNPQEITYNEDQQIIIDEKESELLGQEINEIILGVLQDQNNILQKKDVEIQQNNIEVSLDRVQKENSQKQIKNKSKINNKKANPQITFQQNSRKPFDLTNLYNFKLNNYNEFRDKFLSSYFNNEKRLHHLKKIGLITEEGYIINKPEDYMRKKEIFRKALEKQIAKNQNTSFNQHLLATEQNPYKEIPNSIWSKSFKKSKI